MLAADGRCKVLDAAADGYVRSEDCIVVVLEAADEDTPSCRAILRGSAVGQVCARRGYTSLQNSPQAAIRSLTMGSCTEHAWCTRFAMCCSVRH